MTYKINFNALTSTGVYVGTRHLTVETIRPLILEGKQPMLERMCVEFARLTGLKCSSAQIVEITLKEG